MQNRFWPMASCRAEVAEIEMSYFHHICSSIYNKFFYIVLSIFGVYFLNLVLGVYFYTVVSVCFVIVIYYKFIRWLQKIGYFDGFDKIEDPFVDKIGRPIHDIDLCDFRLYRQGIVCVH